MPLLPKLTIIMLTYNRQRYALRNMGWWSGTGTTMHVLDGSAQAISARDLAGIASNIRYHHCPVSIWMRMHKAAALVDTEYAVLLADDDVFVPSAIEASILQLDNDEEIVACCGQGIGKLLAKGLTIHQSAIEAIPLSNREAVSAALTQNDPVQRMIAHMSPYTPNIIYSICRSKPWIETIQLLASRQFASGMVGEIQFELSMSFKGKTQVINDLMWLRSAENDTQTEGFELAFHTWFLDARYRDDVDDFLDVTARTLAAAGDLEVNTIRNGLASACKGYALACAGAAQSAPSSAFRQLSRRFLTRHLPSAFKAAARKWISGLPAPLVSTLPQRLRFRPYVDLVERLAASGVRVDWNQVNAILQTVRTFHDNNSDGGRSATYGH